VRIAKLITFWTLAFLAVAVLVYPPWYNNDGGKMWRGRCFIFTPYLDKGYAAVSPDLYEIAVELAILAILALVAWRSWPYFTGEK